MSNIDISGLSKEAVLAALYNASKPQGMGFLHYDPTPMTEEQAAELLGVGDDHTQEFGSFVHGGNTAYFDYLKGRVMKVDLSGDELDPAGYDRDNGEGAAAFVIKYLRETGEVVSLTGAEQHEQGKVEAAFTVMDNIDEPTTFEGGVFRLGLADVADELRDAVRRAVDNDDQN